MDQTIDEPKETIYAVGGFSDIRKLREDVRQWLEIRREAGLAIDPETAEADWTYAQVCDPYGSRPDLPEEYWCIGRAYFARAPGSDIWVWFDDLPETTRARLWEKVRRKLAFPAGLSLHDYK